jgi:hypothetical protein
MGELPQSGAVVDLPDRCAPTLLGVSERLSASGKEESYAGRSVRDVKMPTLIEWLEPVIDATIQRLNKSG